MYSYLIIILYDSLLFVEFIHVKFMNYFLNYYILEEFLVDIVGLSLGPLGTNCYIIYNDDEALIVDPSGDAEKISSFLSERNLTPVAILLTHAHFDHIGALDIIRKKYDLDVYLHKNEFEWLENPELNRSIFM